MSTAHIPEFPLPPAQEFFLRQAPSENALLSISFGRQLDEPLCRHAWLCLVRQHPILRSSFSPGLLREYPFGPSLPFPWQELDWASSHPSEIPALWQALQSREQTQPFDPSSPPLWRAHFITLPDHKNHLLLSFHPALLDEEAASLLLLQLALLCDNPPDLANLPPPLPGLPAAIGGLDLPSHPDLITHFLLNLDPESACPPAAVLDANPSAPPSPHPVSVSADLPIQWLEALLARASSCQTTPALLASLLASAFWASRCGSSESLSLVPFDIRPLLPAECASVLGHLTPLAPFRCRWQPSDPQSWWDAQLAALKDIAPLAVSSWHSALATWAATQGFTQPDLVPGFTLKWRLPAIHDRLHTAMPQWLPCDARWIEPPSAPLEFHIHPARIPKISALLAPGWLPTDLPALLLSEFLQWSSQLLIPDSTPPSPSPAPPKPEQPAFHLEASPGLPALIESALERLPSRPLLESPENSLTAAESALLSGQLIRHLRKSAPQDPPRAVVALAHGFYASLAALALLRDSWDVLWLPPDASPASLQNLPDWQNALLLLDSSTLPSWENHHTRRLVLDQEWEKIAAHPATAPLRRKKPAPSTWAFLPNGDTPLQFPQHALAEAFLRLPTLWAPPAGIELPPDIPCPRILATGLPGHPWHIEELLSALALNGTLALPTSDLFSTRSAFQEHLLSGKITHLALPAARFADWLHFLSELNQPLPPTLRRILIRAGRLGARVLSTWRTLSPAPHTASIFYSPLGLAGLGLCSPLPAPSEPLPQGLHLLGTPLPGIQAQILSTENLPLPHGAIGRLVFSFPNPPHPTLTAPPSQDIPPLRGLRMADNRILSLESPDWPPSEPSTPTIPRRARAALEAACLTHPAIFDAAIAPATTSANPGDPAATPAQPLNQPAAHAWLIPADTGSPVPGDFKNHATAGHWQITKAATIPKWPVTPAGTIQRSALPEPLPLPEKQPGPPPPPPQPPAIPAAAAAPDTPTPAPTPTPRSQSQPRIKPGWHLLSQPSPDKALLLISGQLPFPGTDSALASTAGADWTVALCQQWNDDAARTLIATPRSQAVVIAFGAAVWELARWESRRLAASYISRSWDWLFVEPLIESPAEPQPSLIRSWWERLRGSSLPQANARREASAPPRPCPMDAPVKILTASQPSARLAQFFPQGEFFIGDLHSPHGIAGAIFDILRGQVESDDPPPPSETPAA